MEFRKPRLNMTVICGDVKESQNKYKGFFCDFPQVRIHFHNFMKMLRFVHFYFIVKNNHTEYKQNVSSSYMIKVSI